MPHLILEYSGNIEAEETFSSLFAKCHAVLAEVLPTNIQSCMSRAIKQDNYYVGNGDSQNGFIYLQCKVLKGRTKETLQKAAEQLFFIVKEHFADYSQQPQIRIAVEMTELSEVYVK